MTTKILTRTGQCVADAALIAGIAFGATHFLYPCWSRVTSTLTVDR